MSLISGTENPLIFLFFHHKPENTTTLKRLLFERLCRKSHRLGHQVKQELLLLALIVGAPSE